MLQCSGSARKKLVEKFLLSVERYIEWNTVIIPVHMNIRVILIGELFSPNFRHFFAQFFNLPYFPVFFFQILEC